MTEAEIIAAGKAITGNTIKEGKAIIDLSQLALLNEILEASGGGSGSSNVTITSADPGFSDDIGAIADTAQTDYTQAASIISVLKGLLKQLQGDGSGETPVTLATSLSSEYDTIDVNKMSKGGITVAHDAITATATGDEIDCRGFNAASVECAVSAITSGNWVIEILGCAVSGGTFGRVYDSGFGEMKTDPLNTEETITFSFVGVPNYIKVKATRTTDGTLTCTITPMNL